MLKNSELPKGHHLAPKDIKTLERLYDDLKIESSHFIGYPCNSVFDYSALNPFMQFLINNVGDPFRPNSFKVNTHSIEVEVIEWFSNLLHGKDLWGYVNSGGTEGNMYAAYLAREIYPNGIFYYCESAHYSIPKILRLVNARHIAIKAQPNGEMDYDDLAKAVELYRGIPAIIFANIGTTMTGAIDNIPKIKSVLTDNAITSYYIHADAALSGMILPFVDDPQPFDFRAGIHSIAISGHKMVGNPIPCGVVLAKTQYVERISRSINYIGSEDTTLSGSRNGITPLFLWYAIKTVGYDGFKEKITECLNNAQYCLDELNRIDIKAWKNKNSNIVVFPTIHREILNEWQIAIDNDTSHVITMPQVTKAMIDKFIKDLSIKQNQ